MSNVRLSQLPVIVGTAGHIDHGKTSLVRRLTGINTDRLPDEQKRGISIDLGFAQWSTSQFVFGLIDVPGHERFIRNMVAGATGLDLALLVVAADDGVMPQTREHLAILELLGVRAGLVVMSKIDLVETALQDLVEEEIRDLTAGTFLDKSPIVRVSSLTGSGFEQLQDTLLSIAASCNWAVPRAVFRMPIDQVFSKTGHGTVVTGTVLSGTVGKDTVVEVLPTRTQARVRSVQNHGLGNDLSSAHRRTGVNLAGVKREELYRGCEIATPGYLRPTRRMLTHVKLLADAAVLLKDRMTLRLHIGTFETSARLVLKGVGPGRGETCYAELRTVQPVIAEYGQHFILRHLSPAVTIAGGQILDPEIEPRLRIKDLDCYGAIRRTPNPEVRISAIMANRIRNDLTALELACRAGCALEDVPVILVRLQQQQIIRNLGTEDLPCWVHCDQWNRVYAAGQQAILQLMSEHRPRRTLPDMQIVNALRQALGEALHRPILRELLASGWLRHAGDRCGPADLQITLSKRQADLLQAALTTIAAGALAPPNLKELSIAVEQPVEKLESLLQVAIDDGRLVQIAEGLFYDPLAAEKVRRICAPLFANDARVTVSQLREAWGVTRKHAFPLCEWLNAIEITQRIGDVHIAGPKFVVEHTGIIARSKSRV
jgi:selenocysteine-specific elongation factor